MDFYIKLINGNPVLQIAIQTVGFFHQKDTTRLVFFPCFGLLFEEFDHLFELSTSGFLGCFIIRVFVHHG